MIMLADGDASRVDMSPCIPLVALHVFGKVGSLGMGPAAHIKQPRRFHETTWLDTLDLTGLDVNQLYDYGTCDQWAFRRIKAHQPDASGRFIGSLQARGGHGSGVRSCSGGIVELSLE